MEQDFNDYIEEFKNYSLKEKQSIVIENLKTLTAFSKKMCSNIDVPNEIIINKELADLSSPDYTEDDFVEAVLVYVESIQNSLNDYIIGLDTILDESATNN